ncbi:MAG: tRNA (adenosine(37)-N6)-threonylcarbamoyltransferase complex ATPase subunit type 1 TsaE [Parcubacteria group bacterium]|nr:tRNA (adenosine(37)-N6)-threonylcarbamoyltransferase complex ATPase subunit type 1 TsaE [Parcubacteria group bacterium]MCR4342786.1 tRNA (adenosine(37)-N6)-threonylcarbamoyltransferase complex ATPase subunit type 1 TsaE [Patescibacteria group bacterium]
MKKITTNLKETQSLASDLAKEIMKESGDKAKVIGLIGDLGAGKTTFTQAFAETLGVKEKVSSPTFVIEKIYKIPKLRKCDVRRKQFEHLIHIDAYRIEDNREIIHLGWKEIIDNPKNIILVEWADKVEEILPKDTQKIFFKFIDENTREIKM